jgi:hypothetical protein
MCLGNIANPVPGNCPNSAGHDFRFTEGPVSAAGGSISNLWAETGTAVPAGSSSNVKVIDENQAGIQTMVFECTAPIGPGSTTCSNTGSVPIAAGHYLMVRIETTAPPTSWRVNFRY